MHFSEAELACRGRNCCGRTNGCKPELLTALEDLRALIGRPITVMSAYRCREHNALIGGAKKSQHVEGIAADIRVEGISVAALEAMARKVEAFKGIGRDDHGGYVHVDVRATPAQWCYEKSGKQCAYYAVQGVEST